MSRKNRPVLSLRGETSTAPEPLAQAPADPNAPLEKPSMTPTDTIDQQFEAAMQPEAPAPIEVQTGPTAKEMAAAEEANLARAKAIIDRQQEQAAAQAVEDTRPTLIGLAAQGMDALHDAIRAASEVKPEPYIPPPRTERQMTQLEQELEAGRRAGLRAAEQAEIGRVARARQAAEDKAKEGFTTPVYRPDDMVPDPMTGKMGPISS